MEGEVLVGNLTTMIPTKQYRGDEYKPLLAAAAATQTKHQNGRTKRRLRRSAAMALGGGTSDIKCADSFRFHVWLSLLSTIYFARPKLFDEQ